MVSSPNLIALPPVPALVASTRGAILFSPDGSLDVLTLPDAARRAPSLRPIVCHAPALATRLKIGRFPAYDVLELFAFVRPARFCLPTVRGLAEALGFDRPLRQEEEAQTLIAATRRLLMELAHLNGRVQADARSVVWAMSRASVGNSARGVGWAWQAPVMAALGLAGETPHSASAAAGLRVWDRLPKWEELPPCSPTGNAPVESAEARTRLTEILGVNAEDRPQQADYASAVTAAFLPRETIGAPNVVLAEAGTGVGKTLGYIAPASVWAEKNMGTVWISTYTRNLQRQLDSELDRLFPDPTRKARKVVVRKGRENYLCLLNMEDAVRGLAVRPHEAVALGLMARWAMCTRDGDLTGGDFPGWLADIVGRSATVGLADRRGECIHAACPHYQRCPIERTIRRARRARIVVANHALVMVQAALGGLDDGELPSRYVFDEGHHVFDAADGAFSAHLSGVETAELRRWLLGAEDGARSRARGLQARIAEMIEGEEDALVAIDAIMAASHVLPGPAWSARISGGAPHGPTEAFLALVRQQVYARDRNSNSPYSLETETAPPVEGLERAATALDLALKRLADPLRALSNTLNKRLDDEAAELDSSQRQRIESLVRSIQRRALLPVAAWRGMTQCVGAPTPPEFVDWFGVERKGGRDMDVGMHRHWIDPTKPFAASLADVAHGILITSATLRDGSGDVDADWRAAERLTGAVHMPLLPVRAAVPSPFDYPRATRVMVVTDVRKDDLNQVAAAYRELFVAAGGGAIGLFTAVSRLRAVHERIAAALDADDIPLLAQHVDGIDTSTLVDIFRAEENACLLGTDAVRDGVDVPGRSLRLIVFDRVPWPRPDILHKARRAAFAALVGGSSNAHDDRITRLRLKQAYGRLVRRTDDTGVFVLLDPMMPSRLHGAFPDGVEVRRVGLAEAVKETAEFLKKSREDLPT